LTSRGTPENISTLSLSVSFRGQPQNINIAIGTTQYGGGPAVTSSNLFQTGSNTKSFTAVAILQLEAAGVLSIDDTVGKWLPQYPQWSKVTIRQLLNMTSGIPTYDLTPAQEEEYSNNPMIESTPTDLVAYVYPTSKTPGAAWEYSNTGYILAQMIIDEASSSKSYETELNQIIAAECWCKAELSLRSQNRNVSVRQFGRRWRWSRFRQRSHKSQPFNPCDGTEIRAKRGSESRRMGFLTNSECPVGMRQQMSLPSQWNSMEHLNEVPIKAGTLMYIGPASAQAGHSGGGFQAFVPNP
jgi:hypothetical protein